MTKKLRQAALCMLATAAMFASVGVKTCSGQTKQHASSPDIRWVLTPQTAGRWKLNQIALRKAGNGESLLEILHYSQGVDEPFVQSQPVNISADSAKYVYMLLCVPSPTQIVLRYKKTGQQQYPDNQRIYSGQPIYQPGMRAYRLDLHNLRHWRGQITGLRLQLEGMMKNSRVCFKGLAFTNTPLETITIPDGTSPIPVVPTPCRGAYEAERFAACCRTVIAMDEVIPTPGLSTYLEFEPDLSLESDYFDPQIQWALAKFIVAIQPNGQQISVDQAGDVDVTVQLGRLAADYRLGKVSVHVEATPLRPIADTARPEGAMLFEVTTNPATPTTVDCGDMIFTTVWQRQSWLRNAGPACPNNILRDNGDHLLLTTTDRPSLKGRMLPPQNYAVALKASGKMLPVQTQTGPFAHASFEQGSGWVMATFARRSDRASELIRQNAQSMKAQSQNYYNQFLNKFTIETPEPAINHAFVTAATTIENTWIKPYGTVESLHHWWAIWQQYTAAFFEWVGLENRSRQNILEHAERQYKNGHIPYLMIFGERHRDFGGNDQTFMWQVQHYLKMTDDRQLAKLLVPTMRRLNEAFWKYEDVDNDKVPGFGVQILTQEDYVASPHDATSPAVAGVEMLRTLALVEQMAGNEKEADTCKSLAKAAIERWREVLWQKKLGRPAYFRDELGCIRPDGQYHCLVLPVVYGFLDRFDSWTTIRHLRDRLTGPMGEIYYSNNFPTHLGGVKSAPFGPTWGMQAGAYMQPWAAWALNRVGLRNQAYRPLRVAAKWATMYPHLDAWPESSTELTPAYFSNTAANYAQAVIETLFGLQLNLPEQTLHIQPAFPDHWPSARLSLPTVRAEYTRRNNVLTYDIHSSSPLRRVLRWPLPVCRVNSVTVNGRSPDYEVRPGVNGLWLEFATAPMKSSKIVIEYTPIHWLAEAPGSTAVSRQMDIRIRGCQPVGFYDPTGVSDRFELRGDIVTVQLEKDLLDRWRKFGRLGQLNFSRATFFIKCQANGQPFWAAVDFAVLPEYEAAAAGDLSPTRDGYNLLVTLRNNTDSPLTGRAIAEWAERRIPVQIRLNARSETELNILTPTEALSNLTPGDNDLRLFLPNGEQLTVTCPVAALFSDDPTLSEKAKQAATAIALPEESLIEAGRWKQWILLPVGWQNPYADHPEPMKAIEYLKTIQCEEIPQITFPIAYKDRLAVASHRIGQPKISIKTDLRLKKIYLLVLPLVENHDIFTRCAAVTVTCKREVVDSSAECASWTEQRYKDVVFRHVLTTPGDLDSFLAEYHVGPLATARGRRCSRYGLLAQLGPDQNDWPEAVPLADPYGLWPLLMPPPRNNWQQGAFNSFPQPQFWACCPQIRTNSATFNVVQINLDRQRLVRKIEIESLLQDAAIGIVSVVGISATD